MDSLIWKAKQLIKKFLPLALVLGLLYGLYSYQQRGYFRRGVGHGISRIVGKVPFFGSRFKGRHVSRGKKHYRKHRGHHYRGGRKHYRRRR